jgi:hypothetical protein
VHRHAGVDHGVDEHDGAALDLRVQVLEEPDPAVAGAVARQLEEVEVVVPGEGAREVADERDAGLERADEQRLRPLVVAAQLGTELADATADLVAVEKDLSYALVELDRRAQEAFRSPYRTARRSKSRS